MLDRLIARSGHRRGFGEAGLLVDWAAVVGQELAKRTLPERLVRGRGGEPGGTLHLRVASGWATEVQHLEPTIIERINGYLGYKAVRRLALRQGSLPVPEHRRPEPRPLTVAEEETLATAVAGVSDPELAEALRDLGRAVLRRSPGGT